MHRLATVLAALASSLAAQGTLGPYELPRHELPWPAAQTSAPTWSGPHQSMTVGDFVPGHIGRAVVVARGGAVYMAFQPTLFQRIHSVAAPTLGGLSELCALPRRGQHDLLAAVVPQGLVILEYDPDAGFVPVGSAQPTAGFAGARRLVGGAHDAGSGVEHHVLAIHPGWVRSALVLADGTVVPGPQILPPPGASVLDAVAVDWVAGGVPEVAVLTTVGAFVVDAAGAAIDGALGSPAAGRLTAMEINGVASVCAVVRTAGGGSLLQTWQSNGTNTASPLFQLTGEPTGIAVLNVNGDGYPDVIVSTTSSIRDVFVGGPTGPSPVHGHVRISDVDLATLPISPAANTLGLVVDDIDRNGNQDLVIAQEATNQIVVITDVFPAVEFAAYGITTDGDAKKAIGEVEANGQVHSDISWAFQGMPSPEAHDGLVLRATMPDWLTGANEPGFHLRVYVYRSGDDGRIDLSSAECYRYQLPAGVVAGDEFEVLVPMPRQATLAMGQAHRRVLEIALVDELGGSKGSTLVEYGVAYTMVKLGSLKLPSKWSLLWGFSMIQALSPAIWFAGAGLPLGVPYDEESFEGNHRYIGWIVVMPYVPIDETGPKVEATFDLDNGTLR